MRVIRCNNTRVYLDERSLRDGVLRLDGGALSEQCEGCGEDIIETGQVATVALGGGEAVKCRECGAIYYIKEALF